MYILQYNIMYIMYILYILYSTLATTVAYKLILKYYTRVHYISPTL